MLFRSLGAAFAVVASDLLIQFGVLGLIVIRQTLQRPLLHVAFLVLLMAFTTLGGWSLGELIRGFVNVGNPVRLVIECTLWGVVMACLAAPLTSKALRDRLSAAIPR